ncbi:hypothetical protein FSARC_9986 [Fusarium sarcochroum]|uniref:Uncharacterized protein n=1 Tax=Fusarium sarcochroum TaxID=1208366 RepID=A0A8H4X593_9HYPO|nr:hypothetical protein FSARC_9986 [Fusarium sarcochroum]
MRCNRKRLAVALSLLLTAQSAQAGPMWTGRIVKREPKAFLDVRMENSQAPTAAHDGYGSGNGDQTTPRPVFETLPSTADSNPLLSENPGGEKKKNPYSQPADPVEVVPIEQTDEPVEPTSAPQEQTEEPVDKPTFTQNPSAPIVTSSIVPQDPTSVVEKPTSVVDRPKYDAPKDSAVLTETGSVTKERPTSVNEAPTSEVVGDITTAVPKAPTTDNAQEPGNSETKSLCSTVDLGTLQPGSGENTKPGAVEETKAPETPSSPATVAPGKEKPETTAVDGETTTFAYQPTPSGFLTTQPLPINSKQPSQVYPNPPTTAAEEAPGSSAVETEPATATTETVSVVEPKDPQLQTTSDAPAQPAPTSEAVQPNNPAPTSEAQQPSAPVEAPSGQQPDTPAATTAPAQPQNPVPTSEPAQPNNPAPTSEVQQPSAPADTSAVQQPAPAPTSENAQPNYPAPDSNTQTAAPPTSTVVVSDPSVPDASSAPNAAPSGTSANGVPTIQTGAPTGTSAIPAAAYASNVVDARTYNEEFAKLTPESPCMKGQAACINGQTGLCDDNGAFKLTPCDTTGEKCFALPLYNFEGGIKIVCEDPATATKILGGSPSNGDENTNPGNANKDKQPEATSAAEKQPELPVVTVTTIVTVDDGATPEPTGQPAEQQPSEPANVQPTQPAQEQPVQPTQPAEQQPSQPANGQPSQPGYQQPTQTQPAPEQPTQPQPIPEPSQPTPEQPTQAPEQPSQPVPEQPTQPAPEQPTQPAPEQPSQPVPEPSQPVPEPSQPAQSQPTQPAQEQPSQPSEEQPAQTTPQEPSNPQPTKGYGDVPPTTAPVVEQSTTSVDLPGGTTLTKSIKKPDEAKPTASPGDEDGKGDGKGEDDGGKDGEDKPTSVELIPIPDKPTKAAAPAATEAKAGDEKVADSNDKPVASTRTGDDAHATTVVVDGTPTVSVYFTVTVTDKDQPTVTVTEKEKETVTLVISA